MVRVVLKIFMLILMLGYLIFSVVRYSVYHDLDECKELQIIVADSARATLITEGDVFAMLSKAGLVPIGKRMEDISLLRLQQFLRKEPFVKHCTCVKTAHNTVIVSLQQHLPLLRIISNNGEDYYLNDKGNPMPAREYEADLVVATGYINHAYAQKYLLNFGRLLSENEFWDNQIQQIYVQENGEIDLIMRVGDQVIHLGKPIHIDQKMNNLHAFYLKVLPSVGWHRYKAISIAHDNQVVGIK